MVARLLHEMEDQGTQEGIFLIRENVLTVTNFFLTSV